MAVTVLLLAVWSACTVHCAVENLTRAAALPCCNEDGGQSDQAPSAPGHCICSAFQAGGCVSPESALSIPLPVGGLCLFVAPPQDAEMPARPGIVEATLSPPELAGSWQFLSRAALPARAPSQIS